MTTNAMDAIAAFSVKINGTALTKAEADQVQEVVVEQSLHLPHMFVIRINDSKTSEDSASTMFGMTDADKFPIGASIEIAMGWGTTTATVMKGEVTGIELDVLPDGTPGLTVRGYAKSHRLHRGRKTRSFLGKKDSDIVSTIAGEAGLTASATATSETYDWLYQVNQTNWEFLRERAARLGYEMWVDDTKLYFRPAQDGSTTGPTLKYMEDLSAFRVRVSSQGQPTAVEVRGWDVKTKAAIVGSASSGSGEPAIALGKTAKAYANTFGDAKVFVVNQPVVSQAEATSLATAVFNSMDAAFVQAEGVCSGNTGVKPGVKVKLEGLGTRLSGTYYVTGATHRVTALEGYETTFTVTGHHSEALIDLVSSERRTSAVPSVVVGVVTDNADGTDGMGRVKVKFPWMNDSDQSWWARIATPMAGPSMGFYFLPEINDEVLVAFEHGDMTRPYIIGALWNGKDAPPKKNSEVVADSKVNERMIKTRAGHVISLDDKSGSEKISIIDKTTKNKIVFDSAKNTITIEADADIAVTAKGKINLKSTGDTTVEASGNATVKASGNVEVTATGNATYKATGNINVEATGNLTMKGAMVSIQAQATGEVKASGPLTLKGAIVNIN